MDDDVKNLFQKFGHTGPGYQEINRETESEQARQRWPLLRDVRVYATPDHFSHADTSLNGASESHPAHPAVAMVSSAPVPVANTRELPVFLKRQTTEDQILRVDQQQAAVAATDTQRRGEVSQNQSFIAQALSKTAEITHTNSAGKSTSTELAYSKEHSVSEVFQRLANKPEPVRDEPSPVNSFFKKIFKS